MGHGYVCCGQSSFRENERVAFTSLAILVEYAIETQKFKTPEWSLHVLAKMIRDTPPGAMGVSVEWVCGILGTTPTGLQSLISEWREHVSRANLSTVQGLKVHSLGYDLDMVVDEIEVQVVDSFLAKFADLSTHAPSQG